MARPISPLDVARARIRRVQLTLGLGFIAVALGSALSMSLLVRMGPRIASFGSVAFAIGVDYAIRRLWILAVLPLLCYGVARVIAIRPLPTAIGAALTGEFILVALDVLSGNFGGMLEDPLQLSARVLTAVIGVALSVFAVKSGRAAAEAIELEAKQAAAGKKDEYDQFAKEAERLDALKEKLVAAESADASTAGADAAKTDLMPATAAGPPGAASTASTAETTSPETATAATDTPPKPL